MNNMILAITILATLLTGCDSAETKEIKKRAHLATLACESSKVGRNKEELEAIADACFKRGSFVKSKSEQW